MLQSQWRENFRQLLLPRQRTNGSHDSYLQFLEEGLVIFRKRRFFYPNFLQLFVSPFVLWYIQPSHELADCLAPRSNVVITKNHLIAGTCFF